MSEVCTPTGRRIFYDAFGSGPPFLVITGLGAGRHATAPLTDVLARRLRVVAMDNRDTGQSDPEAGYYGMTDLSADAVALLDALEIARAHVFGISLGGMVALQVALDHPDRVDHLVLMSTFAHGEKGHRAGEPLPPPPEWWADDPVVRGRRILDVMVAPASGVRLGEERLAAVAAREWDNHATWAGLMRQEATQTGHDLRDRLGEVRAPTLVVHGELDPLVRAEHGEILAAGIPGARLLLLPGIGHAPWLEQTDEVSDAILAFLGMTEG